MPYRYLGHTGLKVSAICLGSMTFAVDTTTSVLPTCKESVAHLMLDTFAQAGGNFIDTADMYGQGESEVVGTLVEA